MRLTILLGVLAFSGCVSTSVFEQHMRAQSEAILTIGRKVVEHEAKLYPNDASSLKEGLEKNELRLSPKEIK